MAFKFFSKASGAAQPGCGSNMTSTLVTGHTQNGDPSDLQWIHQLRVHPVWFYLKFSFTSPETFWSGQGLFLAQTHFVKLIAISSSQAGTCGGWGLLKPHAQWAAILGCLCLTFMKASWLTHSLVEPPCAGLGRGGSAVCSYAPNQRVASPDLVVSHAAWTGKQLWAAKFSYNHFRKWDAGRFWEWKLGIYFVYLSSFLLMFEQTELNPGWTIPY